MGGMQNCMIPLLNTATSERFRDKGLIIKRYINSSVYFTFLTFTCVKVTWAGRKKIVMRDGRQVNENEVEAAVSQWGVMWKRSAIVTCCSSLWLLDRNRMREMEQTRRTSTMCPLKRSRGPWRSDTFHGKYTSERSYWIEHDATTRHLRWGTWADYTWTLQFDTSCAHVHSVHEQIRDFDNCRAVVPEANWKWRGTMRRNFSTVPPSTFLQCPSSFFFWGGEDTVHTRGGRHKDVQLYFVTAHQ